MNDEPDKPTGLLLIEAAILHCAAKALPLQQASPAPSMTKAPTKMANGGMQC